LKIFAKILKLIFLKENHLEKTEPKFQSNLKKRKIEEIFSHQLTARHVRKFRKIFQFLILKKKKSNKNIFLSFFRILKSFHFPSEPEKKFSLMVEQASNLI